MLGYLTFTILLAVLCVLVCTSAIRGNYVDMSNQGLTSIPPNIPQQTTELNLCCNSLTSVPTQFFSLPLLDRLHLDHNMILILHTKAFLGLTSLTTLHLNHNQIQTIEPEALESLESLTALYLDNNQIHYLPTGFLPNVLNPFRALDLQFNKFTFIHAWEFSGKQIYK